MRAETDIRPAQVADLPSVVELMRALAEFENLPGPDSDATRRFYADFARCTRCAMLRQSKGCYASRLH